MCDGYYSKKKLAMVANTKLQKRKKKRKQGNEKERKRK